MTKGGGRPGDEGGDRGVRRRARRSGRRRRLRGRPWEAERVAILKNLSARSDVRDDPLRPRRVALQPERDLADLRLRGRILLARAAISTAASTTSTGSDGKRQKPPIHARKRHGSEIRSERRQRRRHRRVGRRRRHARQRTGAEGRQSRRAGSGQAHGILRFHQRRMAELHPARLDGYAHDLRQLAGSQELPQPAGLDRQVRRRNDDALGRRLAALAGARVQGGDRPTATSRRQSSRLADHARRSGALLRPRRREDGRHAHRRPARLAGQQQFQGLRGRRRQARLQGMSTPAGWRSTPFPRDGRVACHQTGFCFQGCKWGAKWSTLYTEIPKGEATGNHGGSPGYAMSRRSSTTLPAR